MNQSQEKKFQEQMFSIVEDYLSGSHTQKQICKQYEVSLAKLGYWLRKYRQESAKSPSFIPIYISEKKQTPHFRNPIPAHIPRNEIIIELRGAEGVGTKALVKGTAAENTRLPDEQAGRTFVRK